MVEKLVKLITIEDLNENNRYIAELVGMETYREIVKKFSGEILYIQDPFKNKEIVKRYVQDESRSKTVHSIARELGKNTRFVRGLIKEAN